MVDDDGREVVWAHNPMCFSTVDGRYRGNAAGAGDKALEGGRAAVRDVPISNYHELKPEPRGDTTNNKRPERRERGRLEYLGQWSARSSVAPAYGPILQQQRQKLSRKADGQRLLLTIEERLFCVDAERQIRLSPEHLGCLLLCCTEKIPFAHSTTHTTRAEGDIGQQEDHPDERGSGDGAMISLAANDRIISSPLTLDLIPNTNDVHDFGIRPASYLTSYFYLP
ncbi:hypothetical protein PVAR5_6224 [Paecilomyces variotii No. 5]|uniref:Uncharacterized protein n=1 Tax=Byssochlamys spectabilis (strain No. 5 / NBRC 109023) TaxID=1356009 RepID=V5G6B9_BYSSN|nr:hypothetical protein PVAR5_6224 [Paecilomyces variotii No. 5]